VCNAVGGGVMRDILVREEPILFKPGQLYTLAAVSGCLAFVVLSHGYGMDTQQAAWIAIFVTLALRLLAIRFNWVTSAVASWTGAKKD